MMAGRTKSSGTPEPKADADEFATFGQRFLALFIDWVLCLLIANGLLRLGLISGPEALWPSLILILEYSMFLGFITQTPGMRIAKIRCVGFEDGRSIGVPRAIVRAVLLALVLPIVTAFSDSKRRGLHDLAAKSIILKG